MKKIFYILLVTASLLQALEIYATFEVEANLHSDLHFGNQGIVREIFAQVGDKVKQGEVLAILQNDDLKALVHSARIAFQYAKKEYDRQFKVKNIIDGATLDAFEYKYQSAKAQLDYQQAMLNKSILKAPYSGMIVAKNIQLGDTASSQGASAFALETMDESKLIVKFNAKYWKEVKRGAKFIYQVHGDEKKYEGVIIKTYPSVEKQNRMIKAEVLAKNIPTGLFGTGHIVTE